MNLEKKTYLIVTGASRGIGKTMAIEISKKLKAASVVVLLARNRELLEETKTIINSATKQELTIYTFSVDFDTAKAEEFNHILTQTYNKAEQFERAFVIHNAGTTGDTKSSAASVSDTQIWSQYMHTNLFATIALNCEFFNIFKKTPKLVINVSSLCGIKGFPSMVYYCTGKAARNMYFRVLAEEETDGAMVLNYAPGPIDTDMTLALQAESSNKELAEQFKKLRETQTMLTTEQTTHKLIQILEAGKFKSGDHVDYYD